MANLIRPVLTYASRRFLLAMLALFSLRALLGAMGTAALALAGRHYDDPKIFSSYLLLYLTLAICPNAVIVALRRTEMRGHLDTYRRFLRERFARHQGRPALWSNRTQREHFLTAIGSEAESYLGVLTICVLDLYSYAITLVLNGIAIAWTVDASFALAMVGSIVLSAVTYLLQHKSIERLIEAEQTSRIDLGAYVLRAWDNVLLNNWTARSAYLDRLDRSIASTRNLAGRAALRAELTVFMLNVASSVPVYGTIAWILFRESPSRALLISLLATVPRQVELLHSFRYFYQQLTNARVFGVRVRVILKNSVLSDVDLESLIRGDRLTINDRAISSSAEALAILTGAERGRYVIRGHNGAGKSSLLLAAHARIKDSIYLPPAGDLEIGLAAAEASTGERYLSQLRACREDVTLLLDEWDANLDPTNRARIETELDEIAATRVVIEVRHH